jgi:hypothetical protein
MVPHDQSTKTNSNLHAMTDLTNMATDTTMILRDCAAPNMGRGAYDTTGVPKPQPPPKPR